MITTEQLKTYNHASYCWHCLKKIDKSDTFYALSAFSEKTNWISNCSDNPFIYFHKECFFSIAGEEYMFEGY